MTNDYFAGIESTPDVAGGEPCIVGTRIPVWLLVQARRLGIMDTELLASYPSLSKLDLSHAWTFASAHQEEIEAQILENENA